MSRFSIVFEDPEYDDDLNWQEMEDLDEDDQNEDLSSYETVSS